MANRKDNLKYLFTVEGECEKLYLNHLQNLINQNIDSKYTVQIEATVTSEIQKTAKAINPLTVPKTLYHLCDVEGTAQEDINRFHQYLSDLNTVKKQKGLKYELGYSNFSFELWMVLHKQECNGCLTHKGEYLPIINRAFSRNFISLKEYKKKDNFQTCLDKIDLEDIRLAILRSKRIMAMRKANGDREIAYCTYKYYRDNPANTVWQGIEHILKECELL